VFFASFYRKVRARMLLAGKGKPAGPPAMAPEVAPTARPGRKTCWDWGLFPGLRHGVWGLIRGRGPTSFCNQAPVGGRPLGFGFPPSGAWECSSPRDIQRGWGGKGGGGGLRLPTAQNMSEGRPERTAARETPVFRNPPPQKTVLPNLSSLSPGAVSVGVPALFEGGRSPSASLARRLFGRSGGPLGSAAVRGGCLWSIRRRGAWLGTCWETCTGGPPFLALGFRISNKTQRGSRRRSPRRSVQQGPVSTRHPRHTKKVPPGGIQKALPRFLEHHSRRGPVFPAPPGQSAQAILIPQLWAFLTYATDGFTVKGHRHVRRRSPSSPGRGPPIAILRWPRCTPRAGPVKRRPLARNYMQIAEAYMRAPNLAAGRQNPPHDAGTRSRETAACRPRLPDIICAIGKNGEKKEARAIFF